MVDALVEIWQWDANGRYHHPRDRRIVARDGVLHGRFDIVLAGA